MTITPAAPAETWTVAEVAETLGGEAAEAREDASHLLQMITTAEDATPRALALANRLARALQLVERIAAELRQAGGTVA